MTADKAYSPWGPMPIMMSARRAALAADNDNLPPVVAFSGVAGSGKSTAAQHLVDTLGYTRVRFAGPLKAMIRAIGLQDEHIEGDRKEVPCDLLQGKTPRHAMQTLGSEWGRACLGEDFWVGIWRMSAQHVLDGGGRVVTDDCRFPNEAATVRRMGGSVYRVTGRGGIPGWHVSESQGFLADGVIENDNDMIALWSSVEAAIRESAA